MKALTIKQWLGNQPGKKPSYTHDRLKNWDWKWDWKWNYEKKAWVVTNMEACCPICSSKLFVNSHPEHDDDYYCGRQVFGCSFDASRDAPEGSSIEDRSQIETLILDNVKKERVAKNNHYPFYFRYD